MLKRLRRNILTILAATLVAGLPLGTALAQGETYYWQNENHSAIVGEGGLYSESTTFKKGSGESFSASASLKCGDDQEAKHRVTVTPEGAGSDTDKAQVKPTDLQECDQELDSTVTIAASQQDAQDAKSQQNIDECDEGAFSWLMCPFFDKVGRAIESIVSGGVAPLLKVSPLSQENTPEIYAAWSGMRNVANLLFVFVFLTIIFSNSLSIGVDQYTIKKTLPRLALAAILVQASFLICAFTVDVGNILGAGVRDVIFGLSNANPADYNYGNIFQNLITTLPILYTLAFGWPLIAPILLFLLLSAIFALLTLGARLLVIAVLIVVAPLAMVAWVLPNTDGFFKKWLNIFIKIILMQPIILAVLALASRLAELAPADEIANNGFAGLFVDILTPLVAILAFSLIPLTFKWAGGVMTAAAGFMSRQARYAEKRAASAGYWEDKVEHFKSNRNRMTNRLARMGLPPGEAGQEVQLGGPKQYLRRKASGAALTGHALLTGANTTAKGRQREFSGRVNAMAKQLEDMSEATPGNLMTALNSFYAPDEDTRKAERTKMMTNFASLEPFTKIDAGRIGMVKRLEDSGLLNDDTMNAIKDARAPYHYDYNFALKAMGKNIYSSKPALAMRYGHNEVEIPMKDGRPTDEPPIMHEAGELRPEYGGVAKGWSSQEIAGKLHKLNWEIAAGDPKKFKDPDTAVAEAHAANISAKVVRPVFEPNRNRIVDPGRRTAFVVSVLRNEDIYKKDPNGRDTAAVLLEQIDKNRDIVVSIAKDMQIDVGLGDRKPREVPEAEYDRIEERALMEVSERLRRIAGSSLNRPPQITPDDGYDFGDEEEDDT